MRRNISFSILLLFVTLTAQAQTPPGTDLWLIDLPNFAPVSDQPQTTGPWSAPVNLTNRAGYDNQPLFWREDLLLYTSIREGQADIYQYNLETQQSAPFTQTPESEYSAAPLPNSDRIAVVRVEADGTTQRLWAFDSQGQHPVRVSDTLQPVGYFAFYDTDVVGAFVLGNPPTFQVLNRKTGQVDTVASQVGRSFHRTTEGISFIHKVTDGDWRIQVYNPLTQQQTHIAPTLPGKEDYVWLPDGSLLMASGAQLYRWPAGGEAWQIIAELEAFGITNITRLARSPSGKQLVFVADRAGE